MLIQKGADVDGQLRKNFNVGSIGKNMGKLPFMVTGHMTPLHVAVVEKDWEIVKYLLANGADYTILDENNKRPSEV
jgi:ankyrin repeat protein